MSLLSRFLRSLEGGGLMYWCQGCESTHAVTTGAGPGPRWTWNGNADRPTFKPSVVVRTGRAVDPTFQPEEGDPPEVCHTFITDGRVQFLGDCTHKLAGQTLDLPELPAYLQERA